MMKDDTATYLTEASDSVRVLPRDTYPISSFHFDDSLMPSAEKLILFGQAQYVQYRAPKRLDVSTLLTEHQLQDCGLRLAGAEDAQRWLVPISLSDVGHPPSRAQWMSELTERIEQLKEIAEEEDLPFSDSSADQALSFVLQLSGSRRPSAFLIGNGNVRLVWSSQKGEQVGLQFRGNEEVQFVLIARREQNLSTSMGADLPDTVMRFIAAAGLSHLVMR
jgi:hypothetical protein